MKFEYVAAISTHNDYRSSVKIEKYRKQAMWIILQFTNEYKQSWWTMTKSKVFILWYVR